MVYDTVGKEILLDFYYSKTADDNWEVAVYDRSTATPGTGFPYGSAALATQALTFDPALNGALAAASATTITMAVPGGASLTIDMAKMSQLNYPFTVDAADVFFQGGLKHTVTLAQKTILETAGYTVT